MSEQEALCLEFGRMVLSELSKIEAKKKNKITTILNYVVSNPRALELILAGVLILFRRVPPITILKKVA
jgi:hypothetical protein